MRIIIFVVLVLAIGTAGFYFRSIHKRLAAIVNNIESAWAAIDVLLKQSYDDIHQLVDPCRVSMGNDQIIFSQVAKARQNLMYAQGPTAKGKAQEKLEEVVRQFFSLADQYPVVKTQGRFQQMRQRISALNSQIAERRAFYNSAVNSYNLLIASQPGLFVSRMSGMERRQAFNAI